LKLEFKDKGIIFGIAFGIGMIAFAVFFITYLNNMYDTMYGLDTKIKYTCEDLKNLVNALDSPSSTYHLIVSLHGHPPKSLMGDIHNKQKELNCQ
jgi:hypothetical protein